jgi:hypothetical protein
MRVAVLDDLMCAGNESSLFDCPHPGATVENCTPPFTDANLICGTSGTSQLEPQYCALQVGCQSALPVTLHKTILCGPM